MNQLTNKLKIDGKVFESSLIYRFFCDGNNVKVFRICPQLIVWKSDQNTAEKSQNLGKLIAKRKE